MSDDIERFLKQAAQRRHRRTAKPTAQSPLKPPRRLSETQQTVQDVEIVEAHVASLGEEAADDMARHVAGTMDTSDITRRTAELGSGIGQTDDALSAHVQDVFDHRLGRLGDHGFEASGGRRNDVSAAAQIARLLKSSQEIRRAIILSEIFRRPEERW